MSSLIAQYAEPVDDADLGIELNDAEIRAAASRAKSIRNDIENDADATALESLYQQFDVTAEACGFMSSIQNTVHQALESGTGISPSAMKMLRIAAESEMSRVSMIGQEIFPDSKYFDESSTRIAATSIASEGIVEHIKSMLDKLIKMITAIWAHIKSFLKRVFNRREEVTARMKALGKKAEELVDSPDLPKYIDDDKISTESDYSDANPHKYRFGIKDKCNGDTVRIIVHNHTTLITANREIILKIVDCLGHVADIGEKEKLLTWEVEHLVDSIKDKFGKFTLTNKKLIENKTIYSYGYFYNDQVCLLREQVGRSENDDHPKLFNLEIAIGMLPRHNYRTETLSRKDMMELSGLSVDLMDKGAGLEKVIPIVEKVLHATTDKLQGKFNVAEDSEQRESVITAIHVIRDLFKYVTTTLPKLVADATAASDNLSAYIRASITLHHA